MTSFVTPLPGTSRVEKKEIKATSKWTWDLFGLATSYMIGRVISEKDIQPDIHENSMSLAAVSMNRIVQAMMWGNEMDVSKFSVQTLKSIAGKGEEELVDQLMQEKGMTELQAKEEIGKKMNDMSELKEMVYEVINSELEPGDSNPSYHPIYNLCSGILYDGNWEWLSEEDLKSWLESYGSTTVEDAIFKQNMLLREVYLHGSEAEVRGINTVAQFIQPGYDPVIKKRREPSVLTTTTASGQQEDAVIITPHMAKTGFLQLL